MAGGHVQGRIALDQDFVYFGGSEPLRVPKDGGAAEYLPDGPTPTAVALGISDQALAKLAERLGSLAEHDFIDYRHAATGGGHLFWLTTIPAGANQVAGTQIWAVRIEGEGLPVLILPKADGGAGLIAADDSHVYWTTRSNVFRARHDGSSRRELARDQDGVLAVAINDEFVYWATETTIAGFRKRDWPGP